MLFLSLLRLSILTSSDSPLSLPLFPHLDFLSRSIYFLPSMHADLPYLPSARYALTRASLLHFFNACPSYSLHLSPFLLLPIHHCFPRLLLSLLYSSIPPFIPLPTNSVLIPILHPSMSSSAIDLLLHQLFYHVVCFKIAASHRTYSN